MNGGLNYHIQKVTTKLEKYDTRRKRPFIIPFIKGR